MWFHTDLEALEQLKKFLKVKQLPKPKIAEYYFEKYTAHVYNVDDNIGAVSVVKIPVQFNREDE